MDPSEPVSIVITTYNRSDALLAVLRGLAMQTDRNFEVIVADDGSRAEHRNAISESSVAKELRVTHVWHPDIGFTASRVRNRGVSVSSHRYVVFLDGDCVPEIDFVARHKALAESGFFINGSRVLLSPEFTRDVVAHDAGHDGEQICGRRAIYWLRQRLLGRASKISGLLRLPDGPWRVKRKFSWKGIRSCNMGVWKSDYARVDGFDESFVGWGHEDADFVLRLHHAGVARKNATEVFHLWHREASRDRESRNAKLVEERSKSGVTRASMGYSQQRVKDDVLITRLGK
jgi:glycosyltransferase involved in cell wall biosynthesis